MKRKITTCFATLVVLFFVGGQQVLRAEETIEKVLIEKQFDVNQLVNLNISHEFGKVYCKNWEKPVISITITAKVTARTTDKANDLIDRIVTSVSGNGSEVNATCKLSSGTGSNSNQQIEITMEVMMPKYVNLNLSHHFGSAWIGEVTGTATIESQYGDLTATSLTGTANEVEMSFGNATIDLLSNAKLEVSYGKIKVEKAGEISLETEYSDAFFGELNKATIEMEGGHFEAVLINNIDGESNFTNIKIGKLAQNARIEMSYGAIEIQDLKQGFSTISLDTEFSNVELTIAPGTSYRLRIDSKFGNIQFPEKNAVVSKDIQDISDRLIEAVIGTQNNTTALVSINSSYTNIKIK